MMVRDSISPFIPSQILIGQYAYKATGRTCAIINITETVGRTLENSRCLLLGFSKAFDTVDHLILLKKLIICLLIYYLGLSHFLRKDHSVLKLMVLYQFLNVLR